MVKNLLIFCLYIQKFLYLYGCGKPINNGNGAKLFKDTIEIDITDNIFGFNPNLTRPEHDLNKAKHHMKGANYEDGFDLVLDCPKDYYENEQICKVLENQLLEIINVTLNVILVEDTFIKVLSKKNSFYIVGCMIFTADGGEKFNYMTRIVDGKKGIGFYNRGCYSYLKVDKIGAEISYTLNPEKRSKLIQKGFLIALKNVVWVSLYVTELTYSVAEHIKCKCRPDKNIKVDEVGFK